MTVAINELHRRRPRRERSPLPPPVDDMAIDLNTVGQFAYGAAYGSLLGAANVRVGPVTGAVAGVGVWMASHLGWIPGTGLLKPTTLHPKRRNALMIGAHLVWGAATALAMRELLEARETMLAAGEDKDIL